MPPNHVVFPLESREEEALATLSVCAQSEIARAEVQNEHRDACEEPSPPSANITERWIATMREHDMVRVRVRVRGTSGSG